MIDSWDLETLKLQDAPADRRGVGQFPPYWWLRRLRRRGPDKLVNYGHCAFCKAMWPVSDSWNAEEAVQRARHRPLCIVKLSRHRAPEWATNGSREPALKI